MPTLLEQAREFLDRDPDEMLVQAARDFLERPPVEDAAREFLARPSLEEAQPQTRQQIEQYRKRTLSARPPSMMEMVMADPYAGLERPPTRAERSQGLEGRIEAGMAAQFQRGEARYRQLAGEFIKGGETGRNVERIADTVPEADRDKFLSILTETIRDAPPKKRGYLSKLLERTARGMNRSDEAIEQFAQIIAGSERDRRGELVEFKKGLQGARREYDPARAEAGPAVLGRKVADWPLGAAEMAPQLVQFLGAHATGVGIPGAMAYWTVQFTPDAYQDFRDEGFSEKESKVGSVISGTVEAAIELIQVAQFLPKNLTKAALKSGRSVVFELLRQYGREYSEEWYQAATRTAMKAALEQIDGEVDVDWKQHFGKTLDGLIDAAGTLPFLMGPSGVAVALQARKERLLTAEGAAGFARAKPEAAEELAYMKDPSREQVKRLVPGAERWSKEERAQLAQKLRENKDAVQERDEVQRIEKGREEIPQEARDEAQEVRPPMSKAEGEFVEASNIDALKKVDQVVAEATKDVPKSLTSGGAVKQRLYEEILGIEGPNQFAEGGQSKGDYLQRIGLMRMSRRSRVDLTSPKTVEKLAEAVFIAEAEAKGMDPGGLLGPMSGLTEAGKKARIATATEKAQTILDKLAEIMPTLVTEEAASAAYKKGKRQLRDEPDVPPGQPEKPGGRAAAARQELNEALDDFGKFLEGRGFATPLDPEIVKHTAKIVGKAVKAGIYTFADFINQLANRISSARVRRLGPALTAEWQKLRQANANLDEPSDIEAILSARAGRPELAIPAVEPEARELVRDVDEAREAAGIPQVRHDEMPQQEADRRLRSDYGGERERLMRVGREGGTLLDTDTIVAKTIVNQEGVTALASGKEAAILDAMSLINAYRVTGTEQARAFRQRRDPVETPAQRRQRAITEGILTSPRQQEAELKKAQKAGDTETVDRIQKEWAKKIQGLREALKKAKLDLDTIEQWSQDEVKAARALRTIQTAKADDWDAVYEFWNNAILSAPSTQMANLTGNFGHASWHFTAERVAEAMVNTMLRRPDAAQWGEFKYLLRGILPGVSRGARNFLKAWESESPLGPDGTQKIEETGVAISGAKGRVIRVPWRLLRAVDEFAKSIFAEMEVGAYAYRRGKADGLKGEQLASYVGEQVANLQSAAWQEAQQKAVELAFQERTGKVLPAMLLLRREVPGMRYIVPFVATPTNIFKVGVRKSPVGTVSLGWKLYKGIKTGDWKDISPRVAEQMIAWTVFLALLSNDPDDPWITGSIAEARYDTRLQARRTFPSQSIKIGGTRYSYARIEPFATALALAVDFTNALQAGDSAQLAKVPVESILGQIKNKTFLSGISDLLNAVDSRDPLQAISKWSTSFTVSWVPNIIRSGGRATRDVYPDRGVWGKGAEWWTRLGKRAVQKMELGIIENEPSIDLWGREAPTPQSPIGPSTDWVYRMLIPVRNRDENIARGDRIIINWNANHPNLEDQKRPLLPSKRYTDRSGKKRYMTDEQRTEFLRLAGQTANLLIEMAPDLQLENPKAADLRIVTESIQLARREARKLLIRQWGGGDVAPLPQEVAQRLNREWVLRVTKALRTKVAEKTAGETADEWRARRDAYREASKRARRARERLVPAP